MPFVHKDGYNVSFNAHFFNSIPHLQLTNDGLIPLVNTTFDYGRLSYVNSLLVSFTIPLLLLLLIFAIYIVYILVIRTLTEDRYLIKATLVTAEEQQKKKKVNTYQKEKRGQRKCHGLYFVFGLVALVGAGYGTWLVHWGLSASDDVLTDFIRVSTHSQQKIGNFSQQLLPKPAPLEYEYNEYFEQPSALHQLPPPPPPQSAFQRWFPNTYQTLATYANYTNNSSENVRYFQSRFRHANYAATSLNVTSCLLLLLFWLLFLAVSLKRIQVKTFILANVLVLIVLTFSFNLNLTGNLALSDFCLTAKPVIADITVYKIPSNNFTTKFVNYYLYCELNRLRLDEHKNTVLGYLDRLDSFQLFNASKMLQGLVSNVKTGIENTYDTLHCTEINRLINLGLTYFCTAPVDGLTITSVAFLFSIFLFVVVLFMVTFTL